MLEIIVVGPWKFMQLTDSKGFQYVFHLTFTYIIKWEHEKNPKIPNFDSTCFKTLSIVQKPNSCSALLIGWFEKSWSQFDNENLRLFRWISDEFQNFLNHRKWLPTDTNISLLQSESASNRQRNRRLRHSSMGACSVSYLCLDTRLLRYLEKHQIIGKSSLLYCDIPLRYYYYTANQSAHIRGRWQRNEIFLQTQFWTSSRCKGE